MDENLLSALKGKIIRIRLKGAERPLKMEVVSSVDGYVRGFGTWSAAPTPNSPISEREDVEFYIRIREIAAIIVPRHA